MPDEQWLIRKLQADEIDIFKHIRLEALRCEPDAFASTHEDWIRFPEAQWKEKMKIPIFVAFVDREPVGIMALERLEPPKMRHRAAVRMVYVRTSARGTGVAGAIMDAICDHARDDQITQLELGVSSKNVGALQFYQRQQFFETGRVQSGFRTENCDFDEVMMMRRL